MNKKRETALYGHWSALAGFSTYDLVDPDFDEDEDNWIEPTDMGAQ